MLKKKLNIFAYGTLNSRKYTIWELASKNLGIFKSLKTLVQTVLRVLRCQGNGACALYKVRDDEIITVADVTIWLREILFGMDFRRWTFLEGLFSVIPLRGKDKQGRSWIFFYSNGVLIRAASRTTRSTKIEKNTPMSNPAVWERNRRQIGVKSSTLFTPVQDVGIRHFNPLRSAAIALCGPPQ